MAADAAAGARVTLSDVAAHAGVSLATASRALNGSERQVKPGLKELVEASALELGYVVNAQAQAVARGSSSLVALVLGDIADPYFSALASGVIAAAKRRGLTVTMAVTGSTAAEERATVAALRSQQPRAIILAGSRACDDDLERLLDVELDAFVRRGGRVSFVGEGARPSGEHRVVAVRGRAGARELAHSLVGLGYRDLVVLAGSPRLATPVARVDGFVDGARSAGVRIGPESIRTGPFSRDGGYRAMADLLEAGRRPECVFAVTDVMAVGAMAAIRDFGLRPGTDVGVAGFDDIPMLQDVRPMLTTVALPLAAIGEQALEIAMVAEPPVEAWPVSGTVVLRESTPGLGT